MTVRLRVPTEVTQPMTDEANIEDVEQDESNDEVTSLTAEPPEGWTEPFIGDADTAEGQARRAEEAHLEEVRGGTDKVAEEDEDGILDDIESEFEELSEDVEDMDPLPSAEEAEMGELCRVPSEGQFEGCELLEEGTGDLIGVLEEDDDGNDTEGVDEYYEEIAPKVTPEGWSNIAAAPLLGWGWETPVGIVPMGLMEPNEVLDFLEDATKPSPKEVGR